MSYNLLNLRFLLCTITIMVFYSCEDKASIGDDQKDQFVKFYGTSSYDQAFDVKQTSDGGFIILGNTSTPSQGTNISLLKTDVFGNREWKKSYGNEFDDEGICLEITNDGGFIIAGFITKEDTLGNLDRDMCLLRTNSSGTELWSEPVLFGTDASNEEGACVLIVNDGYVIVGNTDAASVSTGNQEGEKDVQIFKTDFNGSIIESFEQTKGKKGDDIANKALQIGNNLIILGQTQLGDRTRATPEVNFIELSINDGGNVSNDYEALNNFPAQKTIDGIESNGNLILLNNVTESGDEVIEVVEYITGNKNGIIVWNQTYNLGNITTGNAINKTNDGGYIVTGTVQDAGGDKSMFLLKTSASGGQEWIRTFGAPGQNEQGEDVIQSTDQGFLLIGTAGLGDDGQRATNSLITLVKTNGQGELE